jgi:hypothetical protein
MGLNTLDPLDPKTGDSTRLNTNVRHDAEVATVTFCDAQIVVRDNW